MRILAISDIHGCLKSFRRLVEEVLAVEKTDHLVLCGDFIDRGPDSKGVIEYVMKLMKDGYQIEALRGNHEEFLLQSLEGNHEETDTWLYVGGKQTMESYGLRYPAEIPLDHVDFYKNLKLSVEVDKYIFVHAGVGTGGLPPLQDERAMLWARNWYSGLNYEWLGDRYIIHGHTPQYDFETEQMLQHFEENRIINIDCGCVYNNPHNLMGKLCGLDLTNRKLYFQPNID